MTMTPDERIKMLQQQLGGVNEELQEEHEQEKISVPEEPAVDPAPEPVINKRPIIAQPDAAQTDVLRDTKHKTRRALLTTAAIVAVILLRSKLKKYNTNVSQ